MIMNSGFTAIGAIAVAALAGMLFAQAPAVSDAMEWEMLPGNIAGYAGGGQGSWAGGTTTSKVYLFNRRTGKVYLHFVNCTRDGVELSGGCFASLAVFQDDPGVRVTPTPTTYPDGNAR